MKFIKRALCVECGANCPPSMQRDHVCGPPLLDTLQYKIAMTGEGELAAQWNDKPHRLVYDLCREIEMRVTYEPSLGEGLMRRGDEELLISAKVAMRVPPGWRGDLPDDVWEELKLSAEEMHEEARP